MMHIPSCRRLRVSVRSLHLGNNHLLLGRSLEVKALDEKLDSIKFPQNLNISLLLPYNSGCGPAQYQSCHADEFYWISTSVLGP